MLFDFLDSYAWVAWLALILLFGIVEMLTLQFTFLMLAIGSLGALLSGLFGIPWWGQILVGAILSLLLLFAVRPPLLRRLGRGGDPAQSNVAALIGLSGIVTNDYTGNATHVKLENGDTWTAKLLGDRPLVEGERIVVTAIDGATAVVSPAERTQS